MAAPAAELGVDLPADGELIDGGELSAGRPPRRVSAASSVAF